MRRNMGRHFIACTTYNTYNNSCVANSKHGALRCPLPLPELEQGTCLVWWWWDISSALLSVNIIYIDHNECKLLSSQLILTIRLLHFLSNTWWVSNSYFLISWKYKASLLCTLTAWKGVSESIQCLHKLYQFSVKRMILHFNPSPITSTTIYWKIYQKPVEVTHESCITYKLKASEIPLKFASLHPWSLLSFLLYTCIV